MLGRRARELEDRIARTEETARLIGLLPDRTAEIVAELVDRLDAAMDKLEAHADSAGSRVDRAADQFEERTQALFVRLAEVESAMSRRPALPYFRVTPDFEEHVIRDGAGNPVRVQRFHRGS